MKLQGALGMFLALSVLAEGNSVVLAENISETKHFEAQEKTDELNENEDYAVVKTYSETDTKYEVEGGYIYFDEATGTITGCDSKVTKAVIPESINGVPVTSIGYVAFGSRRNLTEVVIPQTVTTIGEAAFFFCNISEITVPDSVTTIKDHAFASCYELKKIDIPASVTDIGTGVFASCTKLKSININEANPNYTSVDGALYTKDMSSLIGYPIGNTDVPEFTVPDGVKDIGDNVFELSSLTKVNLPEGLESIGEYAFENAKITEIKLPESLKYIKNSAFHSCDELTEITIPKNVTYIGERAFCFSDNLTSAVILGNVTSIEDGTFDFCEKLTSVTLPDSITSIKYCAFFDCNELKTINMPANLTSIGDNAFAKCNYFESFEIPKTVTEIEGNPFNACQNLKNLSVETGNTAFIAEEGVLYTRDKSVLICFPAGKADEEFSVPTGVSKIGNEAFYGCENLKSVSIPNSITSIGEYSFGSCTSLTSIDISEGVTYIGNSCFLGCEALASVTLPESLTQLGNRAFCKCYALHEARFKGDAPEIVLDEEDDEIYVFSRTAKDFKIQCFEGKNGWTEPEWNGYPCFVVSDIYEEVNIYIPDVGAEYTEEGNGVTFISGIDNLKYKEVGFIIEVDGKEVRRGTNVVYSQIEDTSYVLSEFDGANYLYSFTVDDIPYDVTNMSVTPYSIDLKGRETKGKKVSYSLEWEEEEENTETYAVDDDTQSGSAIDIYNVDTNEVPTDEETQESENSLHKEDADNPKTKLLRIRKVNE